MVTSDSPAEYEKERTEVVHGMENIIKITLDRFALTRHTIDSCIDKDNPETIVTHDPVVSSIIHVKNRGVRTRVITEITKENLSYCKQLISLVSEVRHLDDVRGNFSISDRAIYQAAAIGDFSRLVLNGPQAEKPVPTPETETIYSTMSAFVAQQQYFFEMLWNKAIPADQRIREIEYGIEREVIETIQGVAEIRNLQKKLIEESNKEILIMIPDSDRQNDQTLKWIEEVVARRLSSFPVIKILCTSPLTSHAYTARLSHGDSTFNKNIQVKYLEGVLRSSVLILIIDNKHFLSTESYQIVGNKTSNVVPNEGIGTYSNSKSTVSSYVSIFDALWKQSDLYEQIKERNLELHNLNEVQKDFINIAAHELRNPIVPVLNLSTLLQEDISKLTRRDQLAILDVIVRNAKRLHGLTEVLLDTAKIESKSMLLNIESFDIVKQIEELAADFNNQYIKQNERIDNTSVKFVTNYTSQQINVQADKARISQVMMNLLDNAMKFVGREQPKMIIIDIGTNKKRTEVEVSVSNTGNVIPQEVYPRLFQKFSRGSDRGTGLGLFVCKGIVEAHSGKIWAENSINPSGAKFSFSIPIKR